jgi:hypothetical protein
MRSVFVVMMVSAIAVIAAACGGASQPPDTSGGSPEGAVSEQRAGAKKCPIPEGTTAPPCPEGCEWNGSFCEDKRGIIIVEAQDAGTADASER